MIEWLKNAWADLIQFLADIISAVFDFFTDLLLLILDKLLSAVSSLLYAIPVPAFMSNGMGSLLNNIDPAVLYFLSQSGFTTAFAILGAGITFRLVRKLFTLGQW